MATTKKSPIAQVKEQFGDKEKLVDRVLGVITLGEADREAAKSKLLAVSNKKLLRMFEVSTEIQKSYGSPDKLVSTLAAAVGKAKDQAYVAKLTKLAHSAPARVLDLVKTATRRTKAA